MYSAYSIKNKNSANQSTTRITNRLNIIELLLHQGQLSRSQISKIMGLSKPAVTENVDWLLAKGIILEAGQGNTSTKGGRRPIYLEFNKKYAYIIAIDLSPRYPLCAIGDLEGNIIAEKRIIAKKNIGSTKLLNTFLNVIDELIKETNISKESIGIISISTPGIIGKNLKITNPQFKEITDIDLDKALHNLFKVPVIIKNDVNVAVVGEHTRGHGKNVNSLIYVGIGKGLGVGIILNDSLYEGKTFAAGEINIFTSDTLYLKNKTLEQDIAMGGLIKHVEDALIQNKYDSSFLLNIYNNNKSIGFDDIVSAYNSGDPLAIDQISKVGRTLGIVLHNIAALLDIELIIIGGEYAPFYKILKEEFLKINKNNIKCPSTSIKQSALKEKAVIQGSLMIARDDYLKLMEL